MIIIIIVGAVSRHMCVCILEKHHITVMFATCHLEMGVAIEDICKDRLIIKGPEDVQSFR